MNAANSEPESAAAFALVSPDTAVVAEPYGFREGVRLIGRYAKRHPRPFALAVIGAMAFSLCTIAWSNALGRIVDQLIRPFFEDGQPAKLSVLILLAVAGLGRVLFAVLRRANAQVLRQENSSTWQRLLVDQVLQQDAAFFRRHSSGDLVSASESDAEAAVEILSPLPFSLGVIVLLIGSSVYMFSIDVVLGLCAFVALPMMAISNRIFEQQAEKPAALVQETVAELTGEVHELVDGHSVVRSLGLESMMTTRLRKRIGDVMVAKIRALRVRLFFEVAQELMIPMVTVGVIVLGAFRVRTGEMTIGDVVGVVGLVNLMVWPLRLLAWALADLPRSVIGANRLDKVLAVPVPVKLIPSAPLDPRHAIELVDVSVVHDDGRVALRNVSLSITAGTTLAVVGATGSGKSTLLEVLSGEERPTTGSIRVASGERVVVFQEPSVIAGSVRENIELGRPADPEVIKNAMEVADADSFIGALPEGLDTQIGERGLSLSGGQRQRVALTRALARRPSVLLLDDTTSSLDAATEERVLDRLASTKMANTTVLVAARPSSITFADEVLVLDNGEIAARGTHAELLNSSQIYKELITALQDGLTPTSDGRALPSEPASGRAS